MIFQSLILMMLIIYINGNKEEGTTESEVVQPLLKIIPGAYFQKQRNIAYEGYLPIVYDIELAIPERISGNVSSLSEAACDMNRPANAEILTKETVYTTD